ncbi:hypothetical protein HRR82_007967 [Exophiala dermatitidis]|nr:hypothetical protein HRR79_005718 [Exophiala dermatitidis]KAJ4568736.1 hypothetical protein HRR82_007967 [Exophiala dermatitidis]KAJ4606340.1 hypothetical protein HRR85_007703 [Exophiala dermatitidis]
MDDLPAPAKASTPAVSGLGVTASSLPWRTPMLYVVSKQDLQQSVPKESTAPNSLSSRGSILTPAYWLELENEVACWDVIPCLYLSSLKDPTCTYHCTSLPARTLVGCQSKQKEALANHERGPKSF